MTAKKILGYTFLTLSIILFLAIVGQLPSLIKTIFEVFRIFDGTLDSYEIGKIVGHFIYWILHFSLVIVLWIYGRKWTKRKITAQ